MEIKLPEDDSIFGVPEDKTMKVDTSKIRDTSRITDMLQNTTVPATSRSKAGPQLTQEDSLQLTDLMDPLAGNSVITYLNESLHADALN